jgi:hypothetical protein
LKIAEPNAGLFLLKAKDFELEHLHLNSLSVNPRALNAANLLHKYYKPIIDHFKLSTPFVLEADKWQYLNKGNAKTGTQSLALWLDAAIKDKNLAKDPALKELREVKTALENLSKLPAPRLERLFAEHLDLCSHRLDAWMGGLVQQRLEKQRAAKPQGIYLGAYGYLLNLKPKNPRDLIVLQQKPEYLPLIAANLEQAAVPLVNLSQGAQQGFTAQKGWDRTFFYLGTNPNPNIQLSLKNQRVEPDAGRNNAKSDGFIHAPSPAHAVAAAILRAGYLNHKNDTQAETLNLDLHSSRVKQALLLLEGMQGGSTLAELLGYHLERMLHDKGLDAFLYDVRKEFPLQRNADPANPEINQKFVTTDGLKVLAAAKKSPLPVLLQKIDPAVKQLADMLDAVGDLLLAESVYQSAKGNTERAAAALRTLNSGGQVISPEWTRMPRQEIAVQHRVGLVFEQNPAPNGVWTKNGTPRSMLSPDLNRWLAQQLPGPDKIACTITLPEGQIEKITLSELQIEPTDLLAAWPSTWRDSAQSPLASMVQVYAQARLRVQNLVMVYAQNETPLNLPIEFKSREKLAAQELTFFELGALVDDLKALVSKSRILNLADFKLPNASGLSDDAINVEKLIKALTPQTTPAKGLAKQLKDQATKLKQLLDQNAKPLDWMPTSGGILEDLRQAFLWGQDDAYQGLTIFTNDSATGITVYEKALLMAAKLEARHQASKAIYAALPSGNTGRFLFEGLEKAAKALLGESTQVFPELKLNNAAEIDAAYQGRNLLNNADPEAIDHWLRDAALVRSPLKPYRRLLLLRDMLGTTHAGKLPEVIQLPFQAGQKQNWIGGPFNTEAPADQRGSISVLLESTGAFVASKPIVGMLIDDWPEFVPLAKTDTGLSFHFNQPDSEPAQAILLAVNPVEGGNWQWAFLMGAVIEALEMAKKRLVTPEQIRNNNPALAQVLPGFVLPLLRESRQTPSAEVF